LVSRFVARWSVNELEGHRRAAEALARIAREALHWAGAELARGAEIRETAMQAHVVAAISRAGLISDHPPIVAFAANSANPHYEPREGADSELTSGDVLLLDLWGGVAS